MTTGRTTGSGRSIWSLPLIPIFLILAVSVVSTHITAHSLYVSVGAPNATVILDSLELGHTDHSGIFYSEPVLAGMHVLQIEK